MGQPMLVEPQCIVLNGSSLRASLLCSCSRSPKCCVNCYSTSPCLRTRSGPNALRTGPHQSRLSDSLTCHKGQLTTLHLSVALTSSESICGSSDSALAPSDGGINGTGPAWPSSMARAPKSGCVLRVRLLPAISVGGIDCLRHLMGSCPLSAEKPTQLLMRIQAQPGRCRIAFTGLIMT